MSSFRALLFYSGYLVLLASNSLACCATFFLPLPYQQSLGTASSGLITWWLKMTCGIEVVVTGFENIPNGPCVVISNHQSSWETFFLQRMLKPASVIVKRELLWIPLFGWALSLSKPIAIRRSQPVAALRQVLKQGRDSLARGNKVIIYPEGSRSLAGELKSYKSSAAALAKSEHVPILPIVHNAGDCWPAHRFTKNSGTIRLKIGKPIDTLTKSAKELTAIAHDWSVVALSTL